MQLHISSVTKAYKEAGIHIGRSGLNRVLEQLGYVYDAYTGNTPGKHKWRVYTAAQREGLLIEKDNSTDSYVSYQVRVTPKGFFALYEKLAELQGVEKYIPRKQLVDLIDTQGL